MPYYPSDKLQKNTYSRKRGRNNPGVSPDEEGEQNESLRMVKRKLTKGPSFTTSEGTQVRSPRRALNTTLVSRQVQDAQSKPQTDNALTATLSIKGRESRQPLHDNPKRSPAGVPGPFRRTQSQGQKENRLITPTKLASPFKGALFKASVFSGNLSFNNKASKIFRRPSVDASSTHIPSKTASFHRRPSGSHALQKKPKEYDSWIVPFLPLTSLPVRTAKVESPLIFDDFDIVNSRLRFSPQSCSTPVRKTRSLTDKTPDRTAVPMLIPNTANDVTMKDDVAVQTDPVDPVPLIHSAVSPTFDAEAVQPVDVEQNEAICRDDDPPIDAPISLLSSSPHLGRDTERQLSSEPDSLNLGKMFSGLDIAGNPQSTGEESVIKAAPSLKPRKSKLVVEIPKKTVRFIVKTPSSKERTAAKIQKLKHKGPSRKGYRLTPPRIVTDDQPLMVDDDEDDELLLTSRGWDWDPRYDRSKYNQEDIDSLRRAKNA